MDAPDAAAHWNDGASGSAPLGVPYTVFAGIGLPLLLGMLSVVGECGYSFQVLAERRRARRSSADGTTEPRSPDNDSCLRV